VPRDDVALLAGQAAGGNLTLAVDLELMHVEAPDGRRWPLHVPASERAMMLAGLDAIGLTLRLQARITAFQQADRQLRPWIWQDTTTEETLP
jgi:3-isopropylmalate/(R)-2-methylmalate dehydratase small subunit